MRRCLRTAAAGVLTAAMGQAMASPDWDVVGIRLGMTEAEVRAAFQAYDPKGRILAHNATLTYSDKVTSFRTPPFLEMMEMRVVRQQAGHTPLRVWFSGPVGAARVIGVARQESNLPNATANNQFHQSLQGKYGAPTARYGAMPVWESQGKPSCARASHGTDLGDLPQVVTGQKNISNVIPLLEGRQQSPGMSLPKDLTACGTLLFYIASMDPVQSFTAGLFDVGALAATRYGRNQWVQQLQTEAIRKREGQAQAPRL